MRAIVLLWVVMLTVLQGAIAVADEISGDVQLLAGQFLLLRSGQGQKVVKTGPWTAYGNLAGPGSLKYGGERVRVSFERQEGGIPLATSVVKETEYTPSVDQVLDLEQLTVELGNGLVLLVDSRGAGEREAAYIPGSVPSATATELVRMLETQGGTKRVVFYGSSATDLRPYVAAGELKAKGVADVRIFTDGLSGWRKSGRAVYAAPSHLAGRIAKGAAFRLIDLRGASPANIPLLEGAEYVAAGSVTRDAMFLPHRSYQIPLFLYGDEQESLAVAAKLAAWNFHQDGDVAILDQSWRGWYGKYDTTGYRPGQLPSSEIGMAEFRTLWLRDDPATVFLNVKPQRDRKSPNELHIPLEALPHRLGELPRDREIIIYCSYGLRSAVAWQILQDNDYPARFLNRIISIDSNGAIINDN